MPDMNLRPLGDGLLRSLVFNHMKTMSMPHDGQIINLREAVAMLAARRQYPEHFQGNHHINQGIHYNLCHEDAALIQHILHDLYHQRIIDTGNGSDNYMNWPWFHLTENGRKYLEDLMPTPYDSSEFMVLIDHKVPDLDSHIRAYVETSIRQFNNNEIHSSHHALGLASERISTLLISAYTDSIEDESYKSEWKKKLVKKGHSLKAKMSVFEEEWKEKIRDRVRKDKASFLREDGQPDHDFADSFTGFQFTLFDIYRRQRNMADHPAEDDMPVVVIFSKGEIHQLLVAFHYSLAASYQLLRWMRTKIDGSSTT